MESPTATASSSYGYFLITGLEQQEKLVESAKQFRGSVARIFHLEDIKNDRGKTIETVVASTGTAFLVHRDDKRALFFTCNHNFQEDTFGAVITEGAHIRLLGEKKDYQIEEVFGRNKDLDILLFSVENVPPKHCLEFSTDDVKEDDDVVMLGYASPTLYVNNQWQELALVNEPMVLTGVILADPYAKTQRKGHPLVIQNSCESIKGLSGSPLFKNSKVIAIHLSSDRDWREAVYAKTVLLELRSWLKVGNDNKDAFEELLKMASNSINLNKQGA